MKYQGGKGGAGVYQTIINQIPPHRVYIEPFVGGGNIFERKARAQRSIIADLDVTMVDRWRAAVIDRTDVEVRHADALELLSSYRWVGDEFVYLDPPYVHSTRRDVALYRHEMTDLQHRHLLRILSTVPARLAISGYRCSIYDEAAAVNGWRRIDFQTMSRRGVRLESLWMNYAAPARLADYSYVGRDFRERERIQRKTARWVRRWAQLPELERNAIKAAMLEQTSTTDVAGDTTRLGDARSRLAEASEGAL